MVYPELLPVSGQVVVPPTKSLSRLHPAKRRRARLNTDQVDGSGALFVAHGSRYPFLATADASMIYYTERIFCIILQVTSKVPFQILCKSPRLRLSKRSQQKGGTTPSHVPLAPQSLREDEGFGEPGNIGFRCRLWVPIVKPGYSRDVAHEPLRGCCPAALPWQQSSTNKDMSTCRLQLLAGILHRSR